MDGGGDEVARSEGNSLGSDLPADEGSDAVAFARQESDFVRYFLSLPEVPPEDDDAPEQTFEDLVLEAETIQGADRVAARARTEDPGPATALMLDAIARRRLSATGLLDAACAAERLASWTQAVQHRYLAAFARPGVCASTENLTEYASAPGQPLHQKSANHESAQSGSTARGVSSRADADLSCSGAEVHGDPATSDALGLAAFKVAAAEVAAALRVSPISANRRVSQAVDFNDGLPVTLTALQRGVIDRGRSLVVADRTRNLPPDLRRRVEEVVVPKATTRNAGQLRGIVDRAVIAADPAAAKKRQEAARRNRGVSLRAGEDGMSMFRADLPADKACTAFTVIDQIALINSRRAAEGRTINSLRADAFGDIFDQLADHGSVHLHTILGKGHSNVDPRRPCPNHAEPAGPVGGGSGPSAPGATGDADVDVNCFDSSEVDHSDGCECAKETDNTHGRESVDNTTGSEPTDNVESVDTAGGEPAVDAAHDHGTHHFHDNDDGPVDPRPEADQCGCTSRVADAETARPRRRLTAPVLAQHAAERMPTTAMTSCGCQDRATSAAAPPVWGLGTHQGRTTGLNVTIAATTLAGLDDLPGELDGHGAIPADLARTLAASAATITAVAVNPTCGTALDLGRTAYRPRQAQRDYVNQRDQTCRFPSCRQPAWRCQLDHSDEFCPGKQDSGVTCPCNLACLCKFHHDLKTFGLWDTEHHADDSITFTSPTGRTYTTHTREWLTGMVDSPTQETDLAATGGAKDGSESRPDAADYDEDDPPF